MTVHLDPELADALAGIAAPTHPQARIPVGDWESRRALVDRMVTDLSAQLPTCPDVTTVDHVVLATDDAPLTARLYRREGVQPGSLAVYVHGGGMIMGSVETHDRLCRLYTQLSGVPMLSVDYRLAPEYPYPYPFEDVYSALLWAEANADVLGVDRERLAIVGDSAGGGIAAGVALMCRDRGRPQPAAQILICPMLDDRTPPPDPDIAAALSWSIDDNATGWHCLLGDCAGTNDVPEYAAPARAAGLTGLPRTFIDVGQIDLFRNECIAYASRLVGHGVGVDLQLYPGVTHGFELFAPRAAVTQRALASRVRVLQSL